MQVVTDIPGRLRLRMPRDRRDPRELQRLADVLSGHPAIALTAANAASGGLLVRYDASKLSSKEVVGLLQQAGASFDEPESRERRAAVAVREAAGDLNRRVEQATRGAVDLRFLFPAALGTLALRQLSIQGVQLRQVPWYVLAWYAFDSFLKLNEESNGQR